MGYTSKGKFIPKITKNQMDTFGLEDEIKAIPSRRTGNLVLAQDIYRYIIYYFLVGFHVRLRIP